MKKITINKTKSDRSIIKFGPMLRADKEAKFRVYVWEAIDLGDGKITTKGKVYRQGMIPPKGKISLSIQANERVVVMASGLEIAGLVTTKELSLVTPFHLSIDADASTLPTARAESVAARNRPKLGAINGAVKHALRR